MAVINGITVPTTSDAPEDHIQQMQALGSTAGARINAEGMVTTYGGAAIVGSGWDGVTPRVRFSLYGSFTTDSWGNKRFNFPTALTHGILEVHITNMNSGFAGSFALNQPGTALTQVEITAVYGGAAQPSTFCVAQVVVVGW